MKREEFIDRVEQTTLWDVIVVGGGASGLGVAVDSASRGFNTLLVEQHDFAKGTSSRSTKLVHGGVRYLKQGNVGLVLEALNERGRLRRNAPHLVQDLQFVVPAYDWWEGPFYGVGLRLYDVLAGREGFGRSTNLSREETLEEIPTLEPDGLRGGVMYYDGQFDDARLAITLAKTAANLGASLLNYFRVVGLTKSNSLVDGILAIDEETGKEYEIKGRVVINATGVFTDTVRAMDDPDIRPMMRASQGVHVVLDKSFLPGDTAIMVPSTDDGRVLFAIPWHGRVIVGTTDTPVPHASLEPKPFDEEIDFILKHAVQYLTKDPSRSDILSTFAGLRPLVAPPDEDDTSSVSREHVVHLSSGGLVTIAGGKWTTYRKMAEDTVDKAAVVAGLPDSRSRTDVLHLHGYQEDSPEIDHDDDHMAWYGSEAPEIEKLASSTNGFPTPLSEKIVDDLPHTAAEVVWATRNEMARTVEDVLSRRTRCLLLEAAASMKAAPKVAAIMAHELGKDQDWESEQVAKYRSMAANYLPTLP